MARGKTSTLSIVIAGDAKGAQRAMGQTETATKSLGNTARTMAASVGAMLAGGAIIRFGRQTIDTYRNVGAEMLQLQRITGGSDEWVSGLWVGAQQSGIAVDKLSTSLGILASKINSDKLDDWGIEAKDASGNARSFDDILGDIIDRYAELEGAERTAFARGLFGRGGADIMKLLGKGREEMAGFADEAKRLGIELDSETLKQATQNQRDFELALTASKVVIGKELLPAVTEMTTTLANNMPAIATAVGSVAGAFNALPKPLQGAVAGALALGPAMRLASVAIVPVSAGIRGLAAALGGSGRGLDGFRLGLMGVTSAGGGAGNAIGGVLSRAAGSPAIMAGAAAGVGVLTIALLEMADGAKKGADALVDAAEASGKSIAEVFDEQIAQTLAGRDKADGGFLDDFAEGFRQVMREVGVDAGELRDALRGTDEEFAAFKARLSEQIVASGLESLLGPTLQGLDEMRGAGERADRQQRELTQGRRDLGIATDETADSEEGYADSTSRSTRAVETAIEAMQRRKAALDTQISAHDAVKSAQKAHEDALVDLADAERAAAGDSDEMRDAMEAEQDAAEGIADAYDAVRDAQKGVADAREDYQDALDGVREAEQGVGEAQRGVTEAQNNLNDAREEAKEKIEDLAAAARDAVLDEREAQLKIAELKRELEDLIKSPEGRDPLAVESLRIELARAEEALRQAQDNTGDTAREYADAQAAGIEYSPEVLDAKEQLRQAEDGVAEAKQRVADANERVADAADQITEANDRVAEANEGVTDATKRLADAEENTAKVGEDVAKRLEEAKATVFQTTQDQITAEGELATAVYGVEAGLRLQIDRFREFAQMFAPGTPEREYLDWLVEQLTIVATGPNIGRDAGTYALNNPRGAQPGDYWPVADRSGERPGGRRGPAGAPVFAPVLNVYGSDVQTRREAERMLDEHANKFAVGLG